MSLSLVRHGELRADVLWTLKSQALKKNGLLELYRGDESFDRLGGLDNLKAFCLRAMRKQGQQDPLRRPLGVLLVSPPGCGKSAFSKSLSNETGRPTLTLDIGSLLGSLLGQSEANLRQALKIADMMSPCILFVDELEKGLSGVASSGQTDSGVTARLFGRFLTWMNDKKSDVFFVGTCNDISRLPPEFARAERVDGIFYVDLPEKPQRQIIWDMYLDLFGLDREQPRPDDTGYTGAEIRSCCRLAALLDVPLIQAAQNVVPISVTAAESVERLRTWASGRCLSANEPGLYRYGKSKSSSRRKVSRDPTNN
jgi:SpoVK/Ycf46/Vps4 family AAA+-type ATPase